jgi:hypothetical protein
MFKISRILFNDNRLYRDINNLILRYYGLIDNFKDISDYFDNLNSLLFSGIYCTGIYKKDQKKQIEEFIKNIEYYIIYKEYIPFSLYHISFSNVKPEKLYNLKYIANFIYNKSKEDIGSFILFEFPVIIVKVQRRSRFLFGIYKSPDSYLFQDSISLKELIEICFDLKIQWGDWDHYDDYVPPFTPEIKTYFENNILYIDIYNSEEYEE